MYPSFIVLLWFVAGVSIASGLYHPVTTLEFWLSLAVGAPCAWLAVVVKRRHDREERRKREEVLRRETETFVESFRNRIEAMKDVEGDWERKDRG